MKNEDLISHMRTIRASVSHHTAEAVKIHQELLISIRHLTSAQILSMDYSFIPDPQAEGFRILMSNVEGSFEGIKSALIETGYLEKDVEYDVNEFGFLITPDQQIARFKFRGAELSDSFLRRSHHAVGLIIDIGIASKKLPQIPHPNIKTSGD